MNPSELCKLAEQDDPEILTVLSVHQYVNVRGRVARNFATPSGVLQMLALDYEDVAALAVETLKLKLAGRRRAHGHLPLSDVGLRLRERRHRNLGKKKPAAATAGRHQGGNHNAE